MGRHGGGKGKTGLFEPIVDWLRKGLKKHHGKLSPGAPHAPKPNVRVPPPHQQVRYKGKPLLDCFRHETDGTHPNNPFRPYSVRRLTPSEQEAHRVFIDQDGIMRRAHDGSPFDTSNGSSLHNGQGRAIFVMDERGNIYASNYQAWGEFHHSTLSSGGPVAAAGELSVINGKVQCATAASGHYQPNVEQMRQLSQEFSRNGLEDIPIFDFTSQHRIL